MVAFRLAYVLDPFQQVLSLKLYKSVQQPSSPVDTDTSPAKEETKPAAKTEKESSEAAPEPGPSVKENESEKDPFDGLNDITRTCFEVGLRWLTAVLFAGINMTKVLKSSYTIHTVWEMMRII